MNPSFVSETTDPQFGVVITGNPQAIASRCTSAIPSTSVGSTNISEFRY